MFMPQERADSLTKFVSYQFLLSSTGVFSQKKKNLSNTGFSCFVCFFRLFPTSQLSASLNKRKINEQVRHPAVRADDSEGDEIFDFFQTDAQ